MAGIMSGAWSLRSGAGLGRGCPWSHSSPQIFQRTPTGHIVPSSGWGVGQGRGAGSVRRGNCQKRNPLLYQCCWGLPNLCFLPQRKERLVLEWPGAWNSAHAALTDLQGQLPRLWGS